MSSVERIDFVAFMDYDGFCCYEGTRVTQLAVKIHDATLPTYSSQWRWVYLTDEAAQTDLVYLRLTIEARLLWGLIP